MEKSKKPLGGQKELADKCKLPSKSKEPQGTPLNLGDRPRDLLDSRERRKIKGEKAFITRKMKDAFRMGVDLRQQMSDN